MLSQYQLNLVRRIKLLNSQSFKRIDLLQDKAPEPAMGAALLYLEACGLLSSRKEGREYTYTITPYFNEVSDAVGVISSVGDRV